MFDESKIDFKIQQTSNDIYLKKNKIKSELIEDVNVMENSLNLTLNSNDLLIDLETIAYEDLSKDNSDKYEFIFHYIYNYSYYCL